MAKPNQLSEVRSDTNAQVRGVIENERVDKQGDGGIHVGPDFRNQPHSKDPYFDTFSGGKPDGTNYANRDKNR